MRYGGIFPILLLVMFPAHAQVPVTNVSATVLHAAALRGWAIAPYQSHPPFNGITVFCTVVVDNNSGAPLTIPSRRIAGGYRRSVFNGLQLTLCDDTGKGLKSYGYIYEDYSGTTFYGSLLQGRSTNELYYLVREAPTNSSVIFRLEGSIGSACSITSNVVKARLN